jgi:predicted DNA-binding WGR domain protein
MPHYIDNTTSNSNSLAYTDPNDVMHLKVFDSTNNVITVLILKRHWLECHSFATNTHKYYDIIETVGGRLVAFWGRIFKDGTQTPRFGEIKSGTYYTLLKSKTDKKDYKIMTHFVRETKVPVDYKEPDFKLIGCSGARRFYGNRPNVVLTPSLPPLTQVKTPIMTTATPVSSPFQKPFPAMSSLQSKKSYTDMDGYCYDIDNDEYPIITATQLTDNQRNVLTKLEVLYTFAENTHSQLSNIIITNTGIADRAGYINKLEFWNDTLSQIKKDLAYVINKLKTKGEIDKKVLIVCNGYYKKITEVDILYKEILAAKEGR